MYRFILLSLLTFSIAASFSCSCAADKAVLNTCKVLRPETQNAVNIYSQADFSAGIDATIPLDIAAGISRLEISASEEWVRIRHQDHEGWVHSSYLDCRPEPQLAKSVIEKTSRRVMAAIEANDWAAMGKLAHPKKGIRFSPYGTIAYQDQQVIEAERLAVEFMSSEKHVWGFAPGSGDPITLSFPDYVKRFVTGYEYWKSEVVAYNRPTGVENLDRSIVEVYPHSITAAHKVSDLDASVHATTWSSLLLIFETHEDQWRVVGIVHVSWTI